MKSTARGAAIEDTTHSQATAAFWTIEAADLLKTFSFGRVQVL